jgi:restriction system protein
MEIAARLPWFVSVALAVALYALCHFFATSTAGAVASVADFGTLAAQQFGRTIAAIFQYVLPLTFVVAAAASLVRQRRENTLLTDAAADPAASIHRLSWQDFERLVGASFDQQGFAVTHTGGGGADGGVDLVLIKGSETTLVQCKQWRAQKVGVTTVRELYGVMAARGAARGIVVSAGDFTPDARAFAIGRNIELMNGKALGGILRGAEAAVNTAAPAMPMCPRCGSRMVSRVARQGRNAGQSFWGCDTFPRCRATLPMN